MKILTKALKAPSTESLVDGRDRSTDLLGVGVPYSYHDTFNTPKDLQEDIEFAIKTNSNFIIFGDSGWGKSAATKAAAKASNMNWIVLSVSAMLPEDFGGIPFFTKEIKAIKDGKEVWGEGEASDVPDSTVPDSTVPESEEKPKPRDLRVMRGDKQIRTHVNSAPPEWVYAIVDAYRQHNMKTLVFLDEINHGRPDVLNAAFHLVGERTYSDIFDLKDMVIVGAAGNWRGENSALTDLPFPLLRRFDVRLIAPTDWSESKKYMIQAFPELKDLINEIEWDPLTNPADVSNAILKRIASGYITLEDIPRLSTTRQNKAQLVKFFTEHKVEQGTIGKGFASKVVATKKIKELLSSQDFIPEETDVLPDGSKPSQGFYVLEFPEDRAETIAILRCREGFRDNEEYDGEFWSQFE